MIWNHKGVHGVTLWGYRQNEIWRTDAYLVRANGTSRPALDWLKTFVEGNPGGTFCITTGVEDEKRDDLTVYPNPSKGEIRIECEGKFEVHDMQGRILASGEGLSTVQLDTGVYVVRKPNGTAKKVVIR